MDNSIKKNTKVLIKIPLYLYENYNDICRLQNT